MAKSQKKIGLIMSYIGSLLLIAVNIFLTPFMIKSLGEAEYGVYQMMMSFGGYLVLIDFGTGTVMTRFVSMFLGKGDKRGEKNYIAMNMIITLVLTTIMMMVASVMFLSMDAMYSSSLSAEQLAKAKQLFIVIAVNMAVNLWAHAFQGIITAYEKFVFRSFYSIFRTILKLTIIVTLFSFKADSLIIVGADLLINLIYLIAGMLYCFLGLRVRARLYYFDKEIFLSAMWFSLAIMLQAIINQANTRVDITILGIMVAAESVTKYSVAMQIFQIFATLSTAAVPMYLPRFTKLVASGKSDGDMFTREMIPPSRIQTLISGAITFCFIVCGRDFIYLWMGEGYEISWIIAVIVMVPTFLVHANSVVESVLDAVGKRMVRSVILLFVAVANIGISIVLVNWLGELGAPIGTAITTFVGSVIILNIYYKKAVGIKLIPLFKGMFKGIMPCFLIATAIAAPVAILIPVSIWGFFVKAFVFGLVLLITLLWFGLNKDEKEMAFGFIKRKLGNRFGKK